MSEKFTTPWHERAEELEDLHGHWRYYAAWEEWFRSRTGPNESIGDEIFDTLDVDLKVLLYCAFEDTCRLTAERSPT